MENEDSPLKKVREILFSPLLSAQVMDAQKMLESENIPARLLENGALEVEYDLREHSLMSIENLLIKKGFFLDNHFWARMNRALIYYAEEIERHNWEAPAPKLKRIPEIAFVQAWKKRAQKRKEKE